jgi:hypothetical protein
MLLPRRGQFRWRIVDDDVEPAGRASDANLARLLSAPLIAERRLTFSPFFR